MPGGGHRKRPSGIVLVVVVLVDVGPLTLVSQVTALPCAPCVDRGSELAHGGGSGGSGGLVCSAGTAASAVLGAIAGTDPNSVAVLTALNTE